MKSFALSDGVMEFDTASMKVDTDLFSVLSKLFILKGGFSIKAHVVVKCCVYRY